MSGTPAPHVIALDDDADVRRMIAEYLGENDVRVTTVATGAELASAMARELVDLVILDLRLPGEDGMQIARKLRDE
jgi:DNA-binding response OmpR family regulator